MKIAIHNWMRAEPIEATIARISKLGYDAIEIEGAPHKYDTKHVRKLLKSHNMTCWGSVTLMMGERNLIAKEEAQRASSIAYVKELITMVKELDGHTISVVPGTVGKIIPDGRPEEEWKWAVESMKECYDWAEKEGVVLGIEPINRFETYFINRGDQALALAEEVGENCGVCLDIFHMNLEETNYYDMIRRAKDRLVNFHVADNNRFAPGMGTLDWEKIVGTLQEIGYDGALSVEFCAPVDRTPANPFPDSIETNQEGLTDAELKFLEDHGSSAVTEAFYTMLTKKSIDVLRPLVG